ncbi:MAG: non-ribosomal peptide synthetase, partial [Algicola sp.]|nr:non-ribosomal peptide synthetase [Algicola sp.]
DAVVIARDDENQGSYLAAYLVSAQTANFAAVRKALAVNLPDYMIPTAWCMLDSFPLTANGKVNKTVLPEALQQKAEFVEPRNDTEQSLHDIWCEVLQQPNLSVLDDFFALGGHSLLATQIIAKVVETHSLDVSVAVIFENNTIAELAAFIDALKLSVFDEDVNGCFDEEESEEGAF